MAGLGRTGVLIACYLIYSLRVHANDAIRFVRLKRPNSVQTRGQILCMAAIEKVACDRGLEIVAILEPDSAKGKVNFGGGKVLYVGDGEEKIWTAILVMDIGIDLIMVTGLLDSKSVVVEFVPPLDTVLVRSYFMFN
uniref:Tyrosine specific protein phosphatases domain-containing protein n=1 Tax=Timema genevievae TaxID=629358 RepID=A0A7R9PRJ9_TIMGE|nr:unnamed protein product [Timema genevievae]